MNTHLRTGPVGWLLLLYVIGGIILAAPGLTDTSYAALQTKRGAGDSTVFDSKPAPFAPDIFGDAQKNPKDNILRVLTVDERMGYARHKEMVRVPLFFHESEAAAAPEAFVVVPVQGGDPVPFQADDIRRDPESGKISRMHIYFYVEDLPAWGRLQFHLKPATVSSSDKKAVSPAPAAEAVPYVATTLHGEVETAVTLAGEDIRIAFDSQEARGAIREIHSESTGMHIAGKSFLAPSAILARQSSFSGPTTRTTSFSYDKPETVHVRRMSYGSGPVFAKLILEISPKDAPNDVVQYTYMVPKYGAYFVQTQLVFPAEAETQEIVGIAADENRLLTGRIDMGDDAYPGKTENSSALEVVGVPAGIRRPLRTYFGHWNNVLVNTKNQTCLAMIPNTQFSGSVKLDEDGRVTFRGSNGFRTTGADGSASLRVYWGQVRYAFYQNTFSRIIDQEGLWNQSCRYFQPLTAVVDEPWANADYIWQWAKEINKEYWNIKYWGRGFETNLIMSYLSGKDLSKMLTNDLPPVKTEGAALPPLIQPPDLRSTLPTQEAKAEARKKGGQGPSPVDPYGVTYGASGVVPFSAFIQPSRTADERAYILGQVGRLVGATVSKEGWPNLSTFANTANMKLGTYLCAVWGGKQFGDRDLLQWGRDAATAQHLLAMYGHAQRPYNVSAGEMGQSDLVYMAVTDFWLRTIELTCNEDMMIHPSVYGRYFDMIDVNADIYQREFPMDATTKQRATTSVPTWWRATFQRAQGHTHRWEGYGPDPFLGVLGKASDEGRVGITEACYYMQKEVGRPQTWQRLLTDLFFPAVLTTQGLKHYHPAPRPPLPGNVKWDFSPTAGGTGNPGKAVVTWDAVPNANGYRIYRAEQPGGPWIWLNSPYTNQPAFVLPTDAEKKAWQAEADADNATKARQLALADAKKLKKEQRVEAWTKMPEASAKAAPIPDTLVKATRFEDPQATDKSIYMITAQDAAGRESRWFPNEPIPSSSPEGK